MPRNYRNLKQARIRPDWNKYTLFNLSRLHKPSFERKTYFQQKWRAKAVLRAYHSPYVREGYWERMFDKRLPGVVAMDYKYLARSDGSELAAGRGSGLIIEQKGQILEQQGQTGLQKLFKTPYMNMAFFPLERRLDTAVWRALFASSSKQARQMVVHGAVKVNGKKMVYPGYLLNPGDMFSVEPERVLYATGGRKSRRSLQDRLTAATVRGHPLIKDKIPPEERPRSTPFSKQEASGEEMTGEETSEKPEANPSDQEAGGEPKKELADQESITEERTRLKQVRNRAKAVLAEGRKDLSAAHLRHLRAFVRSAQTGMSKLGRQGNLETDTTAKETVKDFESLFIEIAKRIPDSALSGKEAALRADERQQEEDSTASARQDAELLMKALERVRENPFDASKPYATPWEPRPYMSAFAFIPRYLEVNQNICSAVYLRHPVARPGLAEVPSPFDADTAQLGFNWYLRRR